MSSSPLDPEMIPEGRTVIGGKPFQFRCHPGVSCFTFCCRRLELYLYPYDVLRLKNALGMHSAVFMREHVRLGPGSHPFFPSVMLNMNDDDEHICPFLAEEGCSVYSARPTACRTYPLERAVEKKTGENRLRVHYFMTHHSYCKGHEEKHSYTLIQWEREQMLYDYNLMGDLWAEMDAFFVTNPWQGEGTAGPLQQLAFMVCYNIDDFRSYVGKHNLLRRFELDRNRRRSIERHDEALLKFGFEWLTYILGGSSPLRSR